MRTGAEEPTKKSPREKLRVIAAVSSSVSGRGRLLGRKDEEEAEAPGPAGLGLALWLELALGLGALAGLAGGVGVLVRLGMIIRRTIMETITTYLCVRF